MAPLRKTMRVGNMVQPRSYPIAVPLELDFTNTASLNFDLELDQVSHGLDFVQTIYVRNTDNPAVLTLTFPGGQVIDVPATASGYYPIIAEWGKFTMIAETTQAAISVDIVLLNVPVASQQWGPVTVNIAHVDASATPVAASAADHSGDIAAAGTSQQLFAGNAAALRRIVQNPATNINPLYINFGGNAAGPAAGIVLLPGEKFDTATGPIDQTQWTVNNDAGAVASQPYLATEFA